MKFGIKKFGIKTYFGIYGLVFAAYIVLSLIVGWTDPATATRALQEDNLTPVQVGGFAWLSCSRDDWYSTKFTAKNERGDIVRGVVCSGLLWKSTTVRFN